MPQHKQFKKALKVNERANMRNKDAMSRLRTFIKKVRTAETKEAAEASFRDASKVIDSTARKGIIKKETAARKKSRLARFVARMDA